jgi:hypothetical protein
MATASNVIVAILVLLTLAVHFGNYILRQQKDWKAKTLLAFGCVLALGIAVQYYVNHELIASSRAPRLLNSSQQARIAERLKPFENKTKMIVQTDPIIADIGATSATFEAANFADQLLRVLRAANINAISSGNVNSQQQGLFTGVMAQFTTGNKKGEEFARAVASTLNDEGIFTLLTDGRYEALFHGPQAWNRDDPRVESVAIAVGDRP